MKFLFSILLLVLLLPGLLFSQGGQNCQCSGSTQSGKNCSCSCKGSSCVCACSAGDGCSCMATLVTQVLSLGEGTTVGSAASTVSSAIGREVVVRAGADEVIPHQIDNTTGWQILARLSRLPGVKLMVKENRILGESISAFSEEEQAIAAFPPTHVLSVCSVGATLAAVLDRISEHTGAAFDVVGDLSTKVDGQAKGSVQEVTEQLSRQTGATVTLAAD